MKLLVLMYHRARAERHGNSPELLEAHFSHIANSYRHVLPGEELSRGDLNVCLTFDDGYFDFYSVVFPLLLKYHLRAVLAIPPAFVVETTQTPSATRAAMDSNDAFADPQRGGFCTWSELAEMAASGHVSIAAHGHTHCRLDGDASLPDEVDRPQGILAGRLAQPVESFVFPFGRYSRRALAHARGRYRHVFRIGGALNRGWDNGVLYRVDADQMPDPWALFSPARLTQYRARYFWNRLRLR